MRSWVRVLPYHDTGMMPAKIDGRRPVRRLRTDPRWSEMKRREVAPKGTELQPGIDPVDIPIRMEHDPDMDYSAETVEKRK